MSIGSKKRGRPAAGGPSRWGRPPAPTAGTSFAARLGAAVRAARVARGLTLQQAADRTGGLVSFQRWSFIESGGSPPRLDRYLAVCHALDVGPADLLPGDAGE